MSTNMDFVLNFSRNILIINIMLYFDITSGSLGVILPFVPSWVPIFCFFVWKLILLQIDFYTNSAEERLLLDSNIKSRLLNDLFKKFNMKLWILKDQLKIWALNLKFGFVWSFSRNIIPNLNTNLQDSVNIIYCYHIILVE